MGGVTLTYLARLGESVPPWNFAVPGVTSISVDLHKYGYTAKGASVIMHRNKKLRGYQTFVTDNWLGGVYGSSGVLGTKGGGSMAAAWAVMRYLGNDGYMRVTAAARAACLQLAAEVRAIPELTIRAEPRRDVAGIRRRRRDTTRRLRRGRRTAAGAVGTSIGRVLPRRCTAPSVSCTTARSMRSSVTCGRASTR